MAVVPLASCPSGRPSGGRPSDPALASGRGSGGGVCLRPGLGPGRGLRRFRQAGAGDGPRGPCGHRSALRASGEPASLPRAGGWDLPPGAVRAATGDPHTGRHGVSRRADADVMGSSCPAALSAGPPAASREGACSVSLGRAGRTSEGSAPPGQVCLPAACLTPDRPPAGQGFPRDQAGMTGGTRPVVTGLATPSPGFEVAGRHRPAHPGLVVAGFPPATSLGSSAPTGDRHAALP